MIRSSMIYSALTLVSRFMGLARDLVITARLGGSSNIAADAYFTALAFPNPVSYTHLTLPTTRIV